MTNLMERIPSLVSYGITGKITRLIGTAVAVSGMPVPTGALCRIHRERAQPLPAEVISFEGAETLLAPLGDCTGLRRGQRVELVESAPRVRVGDALLGRVIDGLGRVLDGRPAPVLTQRVPLHPAPTPSLQRPRITQPLETGIRVLDGLLTCGLGQRLGIFAGSGVGKSTLLGQLARSSNADVNVIVLVGERGREVREFVEATLGPEGLARSVVVVATSDEAAVLRLRAAACGAAIAEAFRDQGRHVLFLLDSVTRCAAAQREIGLAAGEPPTTRGYPPSVFAMLPRLLERSGCTESGSITAFYSVLVEGDDLQEPIADAVRGTLDGHIVLSRRLADQGHWPAIDVLASLSRLFPALTDHDHQLAARQVRSVLAAAAQSQDLINLGAYVSGSNPQVDAAIRCQSQITSFLQQDLQHFSSRALTETQLQRLAQALSGG